MEMIRNNRIDGALYNVDVAIDTPHLMKKTIKRT
jgi:hypothetical protein